MPDARLIKTDDRLEEIAGELTAIAEELGDMGRSLLGEALQAESEDDAASFAAREKRLARARRAIEKAAAVLGVGDPDGDD